MKIIRNRIIPFGNYSAINLFGILFVRERVRITPQLLNHERIHSAQMRELLFIPFYIIYLFEWLLRLFQTGNLRKAYFSISFEREAYKNDGNLAYLSERKPFAEWRKSE